MEERNFKSILTLLASKGIKLNILESIFLSHTGVNCWFYTDSNGTLRKKNLIKSKVRTTQDLLTHLIDDHKAREQVDSSITGKLCWLRNSSNRRLLEFSQIDNSEGRNASLIQVKLVQRYVSNLNSNDATFLLSMKYINSVYVAKFHRLVGKERSPIKHPRIYNKALLAARPIIQTLEEACEQRVLSLSCEFMLDKDGQLLLIHTTDCKLVVPEICLQLPIKTEADLASLKNLIDRRSNTKSVSSTKTMPDIEKPSRASFKHGQLRNDDSFNGKAIPFTLDLDSIAASPETSSPDTSPMHKMMKMESMEMSIPLSYTDNWAFKLKINAASSSTFERAPQRKQTKLELAPSKLNLGFASYADREINENFAEIIAKTFEKSPYTQTPVKLAEHKEAAKLEYTDKKIRKRYEHKEEKIQEDQNSNSSIVISDLSAVKTLTRRNTVEDVGTLSSKRLPLRNPLCKKLISKFQEKQMSARYLSPSYIRSQASLALSPKNQLKRYKSPYLTRANPISN
mmetsp:Transcript_9426/g.18123  ORF Transcript_9426/g.18123 Transcript_9426/m.18123 type:complete len:512 (-) Transcript_9426:3159-4694(-)